MIWQEIMDGLHNIANNNTVIYRVVDECIEEVRVVSAFLGRTCS